MHRVVSNGPSPPGISCPLEVSLEVGGVHRVVSIHVLTLRGSAVLWFTTSASAICSLAYMLAVGVGGGVSGGLGIYTCSICSCTIVWVGLPLSLSFGSVASPRGA